MAEEIILSWIESPQSKSTQLQPVIVKKRQEVSAILDWLEGFSDFEKIFFSSLIEKFSNVVPLLPSEWWEPTQVDRFTLSLCANDLATMIGEFYAPGVKTIAQVHTLFDKASYQKLYPILKQEGFSRVKQIILPLISWDLPEFSLDTLRKNFFEKRIPELDLQCSTLRNKIMKHTDHPDSLELDLQEFLDAERQRYELVLPEFTTNEFAHYQVGKTRFNQEYVQKILDHNDQFISELDGAFAHVKSEKLGNVRKGFMHSRKILKIFGMSMNFAQTKLEVDHFLQQQKAPNQDLNSVVMQVEELNEAVNKFYEQFQEIFGGGHYLQSKPNLLKPLIKKLNEIRINKKKLPDEDVRNEFFGCIEISQQLQNIKKLDSHKIMNSIAELLSAKTLLAEAKEEQRQYLLARIEAATQELTELKDAWTEQELGHLKTQYQALSQQLQPQNNDTKVLRESINDQDQRERKFEQYAPEEAKALYNDSQRTEDEKRALREMFQYQGKTTYWTSIVTMNLPTWPVTSYGLLNKKQDAPFVQNTYNTWNGVNTTNTEGKRHDWFDDGWSIKKNVLSLYPELADQHITAGSQDDREEKIFLNMPKINHWKAEDKAWTQVVRMMLGITGTIWTKSKLSSSTARSYGLGSENSRLNYTYVNQDKKSVCALSGL